MKDVTFVLLSKEELDGKFQNVLDKFDSLSTHTVDPTHLYSKKEVAEILHVSERTVQRYLNNPDPNQRLNHINLGSKKVLVRKYDLDKFIRKFELSRIKEVSL